jgi:phage head maturation protease
MDYDVERKEGKDGETDITIRHKKFEFLSALTIGMDPAYKQTSVNAREVGIQQPTDAEKKAQAEKQKREAEAQAMQQAALRRRELLNNDNEF